MAHPIIETPVRRPVLTTVVYLIVITIGLFSLWRIPIDLMPEITMPTITVITSYGNAGPQEVEELVTRPIESSLSAIQGIEQITSTSSEGRSVVRVSFIWGTNLDEAVNDIRDRIDRTLGRLPEDIERPMIRKFDLSAFPILILGASSQLGPVELQELIEDQVQYRLERVDGVATVDVRGGQRREIHVALRSDALSGLGISPDAVASALSVENRNIPAGSVDRGIKQITVRTLAEFGGVDDVRDVVVTTRDGVPVRLSDIAEVTEQGEERTSIVRINGRPGMNLAVSKQSGANTVAVIPVSVIATFAMVYFGGLTLNMMTFGGLALGVGMLVDNAIVVLDNIFHHREQGQSPVDSAIGGAREVGAAVTASTLTTLVVFIPVIFIRGVSGIMFRQLAYVVSFSITCSLVAALTLIPMLASRFLHMSGPSAENESWLSIVFERSERYYRAIEQRYGGLLRLALRHRAADLGLTASQIGSAVRISMGGTQATTLRRLGKEYPVVVRLSEQDRSDGGRRHRVGLP